MDDTVGRQIFISKDQKDIICGSLLGDARLESRSQKNSARLRVHQGWKQKDYVFWKYEMLKNLVSSPPKKIVCWNNPKNNENYYSWHFHIKTFPELREIYETFYKNGKKILPSNLIDILNPLALLVWIMDYG